MKKSIVLFITLLFITALSTLILKNLDDTEVYVKEQNSKINKIQDIYLIKNAQNQVKNIIKLVSSEINSKKECKKIMDKYFADYIPVPIKNSILTFKLSCYDKTDINSILEEENRQEIREKFNELGFFHVDRLIEFLKERAIIIINKAQLNKFLEDFTKEIYDEKILEPEIRKIIGFYDDKDGISYELFVKSKNVQSYNILDKSGKVKYFELSFR